MAQGVARRQARAPITTPSKSFLLIGLRGVGKMLLLNRVQAIAETKPFKSVLIEAPKNKRLAALIAPSLRQILFALDRFESASEQVKRGPRVLKAFVATVKINLGDIEVGLGIEPVLGPADSGDVETDLSELLVAVTQSAASRQTAIAIIIDEVHYLRKA